MGNFFNKLGWNKPTKWARVKLIRRSLLPCLQTQLVLMVIETITEIIRLCRAVEETAIPTQRSVPSLELKLVSTINTDNLRQQIETLISHDTGEKKANCWKCGNTGHGFRKSKGQKRIFCFRCENAGVEYRRFGCTFITSFANTGDGLLEEDVNSTWSVFRFWTIRDDHRKIA